MTVGVTSPSWRLAAVVAAASVAASTSCVRPTPRSTAEQLSRINIEELWEAPKDIRSRDLLHGAGGPRLAPSARAVYTFERADTSGYSKGYVVRAPDGRRWNVKLGPEAQSEVAASRILWALGYHQPATYYLPKWSLQGAAAGVQGEGRFRFADPNWTVVGDWSWYENDFVGTQPYQALIVTNLILNNWDLKTSNNKVVEYRENRGRFYMVRDLGASFGRTTYPRWTNLPLLRLWKQGTRNNLADFESQDLIDEVRGERIEFTYRGRNAGLVASLRKADVLWACRLMARLSDEQLGDAFRAAGYSDAERAGYVRKIKSKIAEGLALAAAGDD